MTYWNVEGKEIFSVEELDPQFIYDRCEDISHVTGDEIRQSTSNQPSLHTNIRDREILMQINGRIPIIPKEQSKNSLLAVSEDQLTDPSSPQYKTPVTTCPDDISVEPAKKRHRSNLEHPDGGLLPIISQTQEPKVYDSADEYKEDPISHDCVNNEGDLNTLASQINGVYDAYANCS